MTLPPSDLHEQLQATLRGSYTIERELGGGGMSRVFLAREIALERRVVLKFVPPELAASVSADRFRREMLLVAQLQHTNIVPVLSAGDADGMLYYSMPYVDGESLRARIDGAGKLPMSDVVGIAGDVLRALGCAHRHNIVHRDIKPDNILLADGGAVVTDFGIAKALGETPAEHTASDVQREDDGGALTMAGTIIGTPAYLAPEQATPGAAVDARTDLYALGCVMYEMLAGERVFAGRSPQLEMVAHVTTPAPPVVAKRAEVPRPLAAFVARLLEKDPDARPASADAALAELQQAAAPRRRPVVRWVGGAGAALCVLAVAGYLFVPKQLLASARILLTRKPATLRVNRVIVVPFDNQTGDATLASLGAMTADGVSEGLSRLPNLEVVDSRSTMISQEVVRRIPKLLREKDDARAAAEEAGAKVLVTGSIYRDADKLTLRARVIDASNGALMQKLPDVSAPIGQPSAAIEDLRRRMVAVLRSASDTAVSYMPGVYTAPPSVEVYEDTRKAVEMYFRNDPRTFDLLRTAIRLDSTYAPALVFNAFASSVRLGLPAADTAAREAGRLRDRLTPAEQAMLDYVRAIVDGDPSASTAAAQRFMEVQKGSLEAPLLAASNALATYHPLLALEALARTDPDRAMNLAGPFYWMYRAEAARQLGDHKTLLAAAREGFKRFPDNHDSFAWLGTALVDANRLDELRHDLGELRDPLIGVEFASRAAGALLHRGRDADAKALVTEWLPRMPNETAPGRAFTAAKVRAVMFMELERWADLETLARGWRDTTYTDVARLPMSAAYAIALAHQGRAADARAIAGAMAAQHPRYSRGNYLYCLAVIAAHLGDKEQAAALLDEAVRNGYQLQFAGTVFEADPFLVPLRGVPAFNALLTRGL